MAVRVDHKTRRRQLRSILPAPAHTGHGPREGRGPFLLGRELINAQIAALRLWLSNAGSGHLKNSSLNASKSKNAC